MYTIEERTWWLNQVTSDPDRAVLFCYVDNRLAGYCEIEFFGWKLVRHRARVSITILRQYWGQGIATKMFEVLLGIAKARPGTSQVELDVFQGNVRGQRLYERLGFRTVSVLPNAMILEDGTSLCEYKMIRQI